MASQFKIEFKNFTGIDLSTAKMVAVPSKKANGFGEETIVRGALSAYTTVSSKGTRIASALALASSPVGVATIVGSVAGAKIRSASPDFTIAAGYTASAGAIVAYGGGAGVYFWNKSPAGEVGLYGSLSVGLMTNIGASFGDQFSYLFGTPSATLAGNSITVSVDIGIGVATVSGLMYLSVPAGLTTWPPTAPGITWIPEVIGIGFAVTAGLSLLPHSVSVMPGRTWTKAVTP